MDTKFGRWGSGSEDSIGLTVGSDNIGAGEAAGAHLIAIGRRRIAFLGDASAHAPEFQARYTGLCRAMAAAGLAADTARRQNARSGERRVGNRGGRQGKSRWSAYH